MMENPDAVIGTILRLLFGVLFFALKFGKLLSDTMRVITTRLMGMILLAITIAMLVEGLNAVFPALSRAG
ncbi:MAG: hypothetical protein DHS20C01_38310 [marine bacterium B5-7]|nr:MAG: hypothetical protein DHS20C01_38310 [marine bacterium B5-7]